MDAALQLENGTEVQMSIDSVRRHEISRGHSATHLLQQALRDVLGNHVHRRMFVDDIISGLTSVISSLTDKEISDVGTW